MRRRAGAGSGAAAAPAAGASARRQRRGRPSSAVRRAWARTARRGRAAAQRASGTTSRRRAPRRRGRRRRRAIGAVRGAARRVRGAPGGREAARRASKRSARPPRVVAAPGPAGGHASSMQSTGQGATHSSQPVHSAGSTVCMRFGGADDRVDRAGLDAQRAADAARLVDAGDAQRPVATAGRDRAEAAAAPVSAASVAITASPPGGQRLIGVAARRPPRRTGRQPSWPQRRHCVCGSAASSRSARRRSALRVHEARNSSAGTAARAPLRLLDSARAIRRAPFPCPLPTFRPASDAGLLARIAVARARAARLAHRAAAAGAGAVRDRLLSAHVELGLSASACCAKWAIGIRIRWLGKDSLFRVAGRAALLRRWGGIPVNRRERTGFIERLARQFAERGRLSARDRARGHPRPDRGWKSGFYRIATRRAACRSRSRSSTTRGARSASAPTSS